MNLENSSPINRHRYVFWGQQTVLCDRLGPRQARNVYIKKSWLFFYFTRLLVTVTNIFHRFFTDFSHKHMTFSTGTWKTGKERVVFLNYKNKQFETQLLVFVRNSYRLIFNSTFWSFIFLLLDWTHWPRFQIIGKRRIEFYQKTPRNTPDPVEFGVCPTVPNRVSPKHSREHFARLCEIFSIVFDPSPSSSLWTSVFPTFSSTFSRPFAQTHRSRKHIVYRPCSRRLPAGAIA